MAVRTTIDIPEPLHAALRHHAQQTGVSMRSLIVGAIKQAYEQPKKGTRVTGPMITGKGKRGPLFPLDENPYDFIFS